MVDDRSVKSVKLVQALQNIWEGFVGGVCVFVCGCVCDLVGWFLLAKIATLLSMAVNRHSGCSFSHPGGRKTQTITTVNKQGNKKICLENKQLFNNITRKESINYTPISVQVTRHRDVKIAFKSLNEFM